MKRLYSKTIEIVGYVLLLAFISILLMRAFVKPIYICQIDNPGFQCNEWFDYLCIGIMVLVFLLFFKYKDIINRIPINIIIGSYVVLGILFIWQVPLKVFSDMSEIYNAAIAIATGGMDYFSNNGYFVTYPNNLLITILYAIVLFVLPKSIVTIKMINIILIIGIVFFAEKIVQIYYKNDYTNLFYIWALSFICVFLYINHIYTDIPFVFFTILCLWIYLRNNNTLILSCFILAFVYQLRPQAAFYIIAICLHYIFQQIDIKRIIKVVSAAMVTGVSIVVFNSVFVPFFIVPDDSATMPVWSYVYMAFNEEEFGFQDGSHSTDRTLNDVKERLEELGLEKTLKIIGKKVFWTWSEASYQASRYAFGSEPVEILDKFDEETAITKYINDSSLPARKFLDAIMRAQYLVLFLLTLRMFYKDNSERYSLFVLLFAANFIFYIFWEIKSRYIIPLYPLQLIFVFIFVINWCDNNSRLSNKEKIENEK